MIFQSFRLHYSQILILLILCAV